MRGPPVRCREITENDIEAIADLLTRGFPGRTRDYWIRGLCRQGERPVPKGYPRYGYLLEKDDRPVGVLLLLYSRRLENGEATIRCNVSSWYVDPSFRVYAPLLTSMAQRNKQVTYVNISPAVPTWPIIEAQGYKLYCKGLFFSVPALCVGKSSVARSLNAAAIELGMLSVLIQVAPDQVAQQKSLPTQENPSNPAVVRTTARSLSLLFGSGPNLQTPTTPDVRSEFNLIVIDGPALGQQDVASIAALADFTVLVVADDDAMTEVVRTAKAALSGSRTTRLGVVVNKAEPRPVNPADQIGRVLPPQRSASLA
jgi:hypothetical protein